MEILAGIEKTDVTSSWKVFWEMRIIEFLDEKDQEYSTKFPDSLDNFLSTSHLKLINI
jgi:hypothetical protein